MRNRVITKIKSLTGSQGVGSDIALTMVIQGLLAIVAYITFVAITRSAGEETVDLYNFVIATLAITASALDFGIVAVAYPRLALGDPIEAPAMRTSFALRLRLLPFALLLLVGLLALSGRLDLLVASVVGFCVILVSGRFAGLRQIPEAVWRLKGRTWQVIGVSLVDGLIFLALILFVEQFGPPSVLTILLLLFVANVPGFFVVGLPILRRLRESKQPRIGPRYRRLFFLAAVPIGVMSISSQLFAWLDVFIINGILGIDHVGEYAVAVKPILGTVFIPVTVSIGLAPLIAQVHKRVRSDISGADLASLGVRTVGLLGLSIGTIALLFAPQIIRLSGEIYVQYAWILQVFTLTNLLDFLIIFFDQSLLAVSKRKEVMIGTLIALAAALLFQIGLIGPFGLAGILVGKMLAQVVKIGYQVSRLGRERRSGAIGGLLRVGLALLPVVGVYLATAGLPLYLRAGIVVMALVLGVLLTRLVRPAEIRAVRMMRLERITLPDEG